MKTHIRKWGNSLALRIPKLLASEAGLKSESPVELLVSDGKLVIAPVVNPEFTLKQLLSRVTPENIHNEVLTGQVAGSEAW